MQSNKVNVLLYSEGAAAPSLYKDLLEDLLSEMSERVEIDYIAGVMSKLSSKYEFVMGTRHEGTTVIEQVIQIREKHGITLEPAER